MGTKTTLMTDEERDNVILLLDKDLPAAQVGTIIGRSASVIRQIKRVYDAAKAGDLKEARKQAMTSNNEALFAWACDRNHVSPEPEEPKPQPAPPPRQDNASATLDDVENAIHVAAMKLADGIIPHLEALEKKLDQLATVIQSCAVDERKTVDANTDILAAELKRQSDFLGAIKMNTKKQTIWRGAAE